jgi:integrase
MAAAGSEGHRFEATQALRQVLNRAVAWKLIDDNPAKRGVPNPGWRCREQRPFDSWAQIRSITEGLGPTFGPMVVFAAATGLRPSELFALEHGDVDRAAGVVQIRRAYANGRVKHPKTRLSRRAVPLQAIALEALDQLRLHPESPLLFPNSRGGHLDFRNFNRRHWKPVQKAVGIDPLRDLYDLRHTYATFALRAGIRVRHVRSVRPSRARAGGIPAPDVSPLLSSPLCGRAARVPHTGCLRP